MLQHCHHQKNHFGTGGSVVVVVGGNSVVVVVGGVNVVSITVLSNLVYFTGCEYIAENNNFIHTAITKPFWCATFM